MGLRAGIDLGTTNSCVYVLIDGRPVVVRDKFNRPTFPSAVWKHQGQLEIGHEARQRAITGPSTPILEIKRQMGTTGEVTLDGESMSAPQVSTLILRYLKDVSEAFVKKHHPAFAGPISDVVITHPAYFSGAAKADTENAGVAAGFAKVELLAEPVAAALAYSARADQAAGVTADQRLVVFDLGGGTFDVTLLERKADVGVDVIDFGGDAFLGGSDFDACLAEHLRGHLVAQGYALCDLDDKDPADKALLMKLRLLAEKIKIALSNAEVYEMPQPNFAEDRNGVSMDFALAVSREHFNAMTRHLMDRAMRRTHLLLAKQSLADGQKMSEAQMNAMDEAEMRARSRANAAHCQVMLAGSSTWMPIVKERLEAELGRPARILAPDVIVAEGAALRLGATIARVRIGGDAGAPELLLDAPPKSSRRRVAIKGEVKGGGAGLSMKLNVLESGEVLPQTLGDKQTFYFQVDLLEEQPNQFAIVLADAQDAEVLHHEFTIVHDPAFVEPLPPPPDVLAMPISVQTAQGFRTLFPVGARLPASATLPLRTPNTTGQMRIPFYEGDEFQREIVIDGAPRQADFRFELRATMDRSYRIEAEAVLPTAGQTPKVEFAIKPRVLREIDEIRSEWHRLSVMLDEHVTDAAVSKRLSFRRRWAEIEVDFDRALSQQPPDIAHAEALAARARKLTDEAGTVVVLKPPLLELEELVENLLKRVRKEEDRNALKASLERAHKAWQDNDAKAYEDCVKSIDYVDTMYLPPPPPPQELRTRDLAVLEQRKESLRREGKLSPAISAQIAEARHQLEAASPEEVYGVHNQVVVPLFTGGGAGTRIAVVHSDGPLP